ncbi:MAG: peptidase U32 family protein [Erysipelotrichaceae bacterium]
MEILAPCKDLEVAKYAIKAHADALYVGGPFFSARKKESNFSLEELNELVIMAHIHQVKVYVALNTMIFDDELFLCVNYIKDLLRINVDALIISDLGVYNYLHNCISDVEIHASTQLQVNNLLGVNKTVQMGFNRVVVARETNENLLREMTFLPIEIEYFVFGALCVSYSGYCLASSLVENASGNRGNCHQLCRYQYDLYVNDKLIKCDNKYLLSTKDLNLVDCIDRINVDSLKIEGRLKSKEYVYRSTDMLYRKLHNLPLVHSEDMGYIFSRGSSQHYFNNLLDNSLINSFRPSTTGVYLGKVVKVFNNRVYIELNHDLCQFDGIRIMGLTDVGMIVNFLYFNGQLVNKVNKGAICGVDCLKKVEVGSAVYITSSSQVNNQIKDEVFNQSDIYEYDVCIYFKYNNYISANINIAGRNYEYISSFFVDQKYEKPLDISLIKSKMYSTLDSDIGLNVIVGEYTGFVSLSTLKKLKKDIIGFINDIVLKDKVYNIKKYHQDIRVLDVYYPKFIVSVKNIQQYEVVYQYDCLIMSENYDLCQRFNLIYETNIVNEKEFVSDISTCVGNIGDLNKQVFMSNYHLNVANSYAIDYLRDELVDIIELSLELDVFQVESLIKKYDHLAIHLYGNIPLMINKTCVCNNVIRDGTKSKCNLCHDNKVTLRASNNSYRLLGDEYCHSCLYSEEPIYHQEFVPLLNKYPNTHGIIRFLEEKCDKIITILDKLGVMRR